MSKITTVLAKNIVMFVQKNAKGSTREVSRNGIYQAKRPVMIDKEMK